MLKDFMAFLKEYGVIGLAIAVVIGGKVNSLVTAFVDGLIMPLVGLVTPGGDWKAMSIFLLADTSETAPAIKVGLILGALLDFVIVAFIVYMFAKKVLKEATVTKK